MDTSVIADPRRRRYGLGRLYSEDARDRAFPMSSVLATSATPPKRRTTPWRLGPVLNQGESHSCTGHAACAWLMAEPLRTQSGPDPYHVYHAAQLRDPWKDAPHDGSTVRAAMDYLKEAGRIERYVWAFDMPTIIEWITHSGTMVMGTRWYRSMFTPDESGIITVDGAQVGGHAWLLTWYDEARGLFRLRNSWGTDWGKAGNARISGEDLERLLHEDGEACAAVEIRHR